MTSRFLNDRARGVLYGQLIGDALGSQVEFLTADEILERHPDGVTELVGGGPFGLLPGQPTDDSEMALTLARSLVERGGYDPAHAVAGYEKWAHSNPVDIGMATTMALVHGSPDRGSQANGALMRISPMAIALHPEAAAEAARYDAEVTHPNPLTVAVNGIFAGALSKVLGDGLSALEAVDELARLASANEEVGEELSELIEHSRTHLPADFVQNMGWVKKPLAIVVWELCNGTSFEESLVRTVAHGGDTDTNGAILGAFLGGMYGASAIPERWRAVIDGCEVPSRPREYWPVDVTELIDGLTRVRLAR